MDIGLILSGGMGKGAYQVGALKAIYEMFSPEEFNFVSAASVGVPNVYAYLTNNLSGITKIWEEADFPKKQQIITKVLKSNFLGEKIDELAKDTIMNCSFYVPLLNLSKRELSYYDFKGISSEEVALFLRASVSLPFISEGVTVRGERLYDGAVIDNIPIKPVLEHNPDYTICIYFDDYHYVFENEEQDHKIVKLVFPDNTIINNSINVSHESILYMMEEGYSRAQSILNIIFAEGKDNLEAIYENISRMDHKERNRTRRITGDLVVTNMNKITRKLVRFNKKADRDRKNVE